MCLLRLITNILWFALRMAIGAILITIVILLVGISYLFTK